MRKLKHQKRVYNQQLKEHHNFCENFLEQKVNARRNRADQEADLQMTRHATEQQVRDMYVENNYDINQFDDKITEIQTSQIFEKS